MWPELIAGASATFGGLGGLMYAARRYKGAWSAQDIDKINARRGTTTPAWNSAEFNRREPEPPALPSPGPVPSWYRTMPAPPTRDLSREREGRTHRMVWHPDGTWDWVPIDPSPGDLQPPPYDGPRG